MVEWRDYVPFIFKKSDGIYLQPGPEWYLEFRFDN